MLGDTGDSTFKKPQVDVLLSDIAEEEANVLSDRGYKNKRIASERSLKKTTQSNVICGFTPPASGSESLEAIWLQQLLHLRSDMYNKTLAQQSQIITDGIRSAHAHI